MKMYLINNKSLKKACPLLSGKGQQAVDPAVCLQEYPEKSLKQEWLFTNTRKWGIMSLLYLNLKLKLERQGIVYER